MVKSKYECMIRKSSGNGWWNGLIFFFPSKSWDVSGRYAVVLETAQSGQVTSSANWTLCSCMQCGDGAMWWVFAVKCMSSK